MSYIPELGLKKPENLISFLKTQSKLSLLGQRTRICNLTRWKAFDNNYSPSAEHHRANVVPSTARNDGVFPVHPAGVVQKRLACDRALTTSQQLHGLPVMSMENTWDAWWGAFTPPAKMVSVKPGCRVNFLHQALTRKHPTQCPQRPSGKPWLCTLLTVLRWKSPFSRRIIYQQKPTESIGLNKT